MNRPVSPIRHDYRPSALSLETTQQRRLPWFALGLGLPLAFVGAVLLFTPGSSDSDPLGNAAPVAEADMTARATVPTPGDGDAAVTPIEASVLGPDRDIVTRLPVYSGVRMQVMPGDTLDRLFRKHSLDIGDLTKIVRLPAARDPLRLLRPGDTVEIKHQNGHIRELVKDIDYGRFLSVRSAEDGSFNAEIVAHVVEIRDTMRHGVIESSLFESAAQGGLDENLIMNLAGIFAWDIDFVLDIRRNDEYYVLYEEIWRDGKHIADGEILAAEFINSGRVVQAIRHVDDDGRSDYFAPDGRSMRKAFIRAPVDFTRVSSNFNPSRRHPVLNRIRAHRGVDYAAPKGTTIKASGDGKVIFRGRKGGYGNTVILQHGGNITTLYAHMSNFGGNARIGTRVKQGQAIGFVGATGLATAAHLHYEYRVNGVHRNPRTVKLPAAEPIDARYKDDFMRTATKALERLDRYKQTRLAAIN